MIAVKTFCDLCFYSVIAGAVAPWLNAQPILLLWTSLLCAVGVWLAADARWPFSRFLGLLLPLLSLLLARGTGDYLLMIFPLLYTAIVILFRRFSLERYAYYDFFTKSLVVLIAVIATLWVVALGRDWKSAFLYGGLYILVGFFLLRQLRLGDSNWQACSMNMLSLVGAVGASGGLFLVLSVLLKLISPLWNALSYGILYGFSQVVGLALDLLLKIRPDAQKIILDTFNMGGPSEESLGEQVKPTENPLGQIIITILLLLLAACVVVVLVRRIIKALRKTTKQSSVNRRTYTERTVTPIRKKRAAYGSNREKVRRSYRKFLQLLQDRGQDIDPTYTTAEIHNYTTDIAYNDSARTLRRLYLSARYDEKADITTQQTQQAKNLLKELRQNVVPGGEAP